VKALIQDSVFFDCDPHAFLIGLLPSVRTNGAMNPSGFPLSCDDVFKSHVLTCFCLNQPPFPGGRDNRAVRTQCQWVSQPTTGTAFMGTEVHALLTQVQSGLAECITHHHPPSCEEVHRAWVFHWHFRAGRMFPLHSFAARLTDK
jgi:hypothetical protein